MTCGTHLFLIDPIEKLNLKLDTSLRIAKALDQKGHDCYICTPQDLSAHHNSTRPNLTALAHSIKFKKGRTVDIDVGPKKLLNACELSAIHMRKDPPFDLSYMAATWLLDRVPTSVKVYNSPNSIRRFNEKLIIFDYPSYTQKGIVSSQTEDLLRFTSDECTGDAIVKPLDLFGGRGIFRLNLSVETIEVARKNLMTATNNEQELRLIQPFDRKVHDGEVRVFTAGGEAISWSLKKPVAGSFLANTGAGANVLDYLPTKKEEEMISIVAHDLNKKGIFFAGFDIIGSFISEINVTSPRLLLPEHVDWIPFYDRIAEIIENDLS